MLRGPGRSYVVLMAKVHDRFTADGVADLGEPTRSG
jgi:hypothetical protein